MSTTLTREYLLTRLDYDRATGFFTWRETKGRARAGARAGNTNWDGYRRIKVNGHFYAEHRLVWLVEHGEFPTQEIDHVNRMRGNNQIDNLRLVTRKANMENTGRHGRNTSGFKGVGFSKAAQKWRAFIGHNGKVKALGYFLTPELASAAYQEARKKYFEINS
jgi:hypothetical protein